MLPGLTRENQMNVLDRYAIASGESVLSIEPKFMPISDRSHVGCCEFGATVCFSDADLTASAPFRSAVSSVDSSVSVEEVCDSHAQRGVALMQCAFRPIPISQFPGDAMDILITSINTENAVAFAIGAASPEPTSIGLVDKRPQSLLDSAPRVDHSVTTDARAVTSLTQFARIGNAESRTATGAGLSKMVGHLDSLGRGVMPPVVVATRGRFAAQFYQFGVCA